MLWLSLGENCLPDNVLKRHGLKSFSTPYSHGRSNIDYALSLERKGYEKLLSGDMLEKADAWGTPVVRSRIYNDCDDIFEPSVSKGFEFTHHNVIDDEKAIASYVRKLERLEAVRGKQSVAFLYHHRMSEKSDLEKLVDKLNDFAQIYSSEIAQCWILVMTQVIVSSAGDRRIERFIDRGQVTVFRLHTTKMWSGNDNDVFWAKVDDDLLKEMLDIGERNCYQR